MDWDTDMLCTSTYLFIKLLDDFTWLKCLNTHIYVVNEPNISSFEFNIISNMFILNR